MIPEQIRRPLIGLATRESVEVIEADPRRPLIEGACHAELGGQRVVVLAEPRCGVTMLAQDARDRDILGTDVGVISRKSRRYLGDYAKAHRMVVAAGDQRRAGR